MDERKRGHEAGGHGGQPEATPAPDPEAVRRARLARFDPAGAQAQPAPVASAQLS